MLTSRINLFNIILVVYLCWTQHHLEAKPLARAQRQIIAGEIATGLTGAGTSFNTLYGDQSLTDSYYGYKPYQQTQLPINTYDEELYRGGYGKRGYSKGNNPASNSGSGYDYGRGTDYGINRPNWKGFGSAGGRGRYPAYGSKY